MSDSYSKIEEDTAALGGIDVVRADPVLFRKFLRRVDRLPPLSSERVGEIMAAMRRSNLKSTETT